MDENAGQKNSPAYRLAALDTDFLLGASMRGVRLQIEYEKAEEQLRAWGVRSTIVVFGSARALPRGSGDEAASKAALFPGAVPRPGDQSARWFPCPFAAGLPWVRPEQAIQVREAPLILARPPPLRLVDRSESPTRYGHDDGSETHR